MKQIISNDFQGAILVLKNNQKVFEYYNGEADIESHIPFDADTTITLASLSKQFVAAAIFLQVENGNLSLDRTIHSFFPQYTYGNRVTIRNLLHHSSGIPDYIGDVIIPETIRKYESEHGTAPTNAIDFNKCIVEKCRPVSLSECFDLIGDLPLCFEPGTEGRYSNTNYYLLGNILEMLSGKPLSDVMREVFISFGLKCTHINGRTADACGYVRHNDEVFCCGRPAMDSGDSRVVSSLKDLKLWCKAILERDVLLADSWKEILNFNPEPFGCGFWKFEDGWFGHDGGLPGLRHWQRLNIENNTAIIILSNMVTEEPPFLAKMMEHLVIKEL